MQADGLPAPLAQPLPQLSALVRGTPSTLLRWQVLDPLYSYCLAMRLYNGDWLSHAQVQRTHGVADIPSALRVSGSGLYLLMPLYWQTCHLADCRVACCKQHPKDSCVPCRKLPPLCCSSLLSWPQPPLPVVPSRLSPAKPLALLQRQLRRWFCTAWRQPATQLC